MPQKDYQLWQEIVKQADLGAEEPLLKFTTHEIKRKTVFLRVFEGIEFANGLLGKLDAATRGLGYELRVTGKWATIEDLKIAVGDIRWLWKGWIPRDMITLLAADPGVGKSTLAMWFCKIVAEGLKWPDGETQEVGNAIYIDAEHAQIITASHAVNLNVPTNRVYIPALENDMLGGIDLNNPLHRETLWQMATDLQPRIIVVDSLGSAKSGGMNQKEDIEPAMLYLTHLVQQNACAVVVIHHLHKTKREEAPEIAISHLAGSYTISKLSRSIMFMEDKFSQGVKLWIGKSNVSKKPLALRVSPIETVVANPDGTFEEVVSSFEFEPWQEERRDTKIDQCKRWILEQLQEEQDHSLAAKEVFERAKEDMPFTLHMLKDAGTALERTGRIKRTGGKNSIWSLLQLELDEGEEPDVDVE